MIETLDDITEELADLLRIYGAHPEGRDDDKCYCRCCWTSWMKGRIREAVSVESALAHRTQAEGISQQDGENVKGSTVDAQGRPRP